MRKRRKTIKTESVPTLKVSFNIVGIQKNGTLVGSKPNKTCISRLNSNKFGIDKNGKHFIIMCCDGIYLGGINEITENWNLIQCFYNEKHYYHIGCLKKKYKFSNYNILNITINGKFICPKCVDDTSSGCINNNNTSSGCINYNNNNNTN